MLGHARPSPLRMVVTLMAMLLFAGACSADASSADRSTVAVTPTDPSSPTPAETSTGTPVGSEVTPIDGIYGVTVTEKDARATEIAPGRFAEFVGDYELDLVRGQLKVYFTHAVTLDVLAGTYTADRDTLRIVSQDGDLHQTYRWILDHGSLQLTLLQTDQPGARIYDELIYTTHPWEQRS